MPGIIGSLQLKGDDKNPIKINNLFQDVDITDWNNKDLYSNDKISLCCISNKLTQSSSLRIFEDGLVVGMVGEIYNDDSYEENHLEFIRSKYLDSPENFLIEFNGTFSLFVYDPKDDRFILAVDRVASKPLFYSFINGQLFFSFDFKCFSKIESKQYTIELSAISDVLSHGFVLNNKTFFKEIKELPNGYYLDCKNGQFSIKKYWDFQFIKPEQNLSRKYYRKKLGELLEKSVKRRVRKDISSGILLSGGVDSRAILGYYNKYVQKPITICYGYKREAWNLSDGDIAKKLADFYETDHYQMDYSLSDYDNTIIKVCDRSGSFSRVLPEYEVYGKIRKDIGVYRVFSGDNNFGRFGKFMGDDEQMLEIANYINFFSRYKRGQFPISEKAYNLLASHSKNNIDELLTTCQLENIHDRKDFFFLNAYMVSLIGKDRMTITSELEMINPWYDSDILDFMKTVPLKYRMDKVLFKDVINNAFKETSAIPLARTVTKPDQTTWKEWIDKNTLEKYDSFLFLQKLGLIEKEELKKLFKVSKAKKKESKSILSILNKNLPLRNRYNWVNTKAPSFIYNALVYLVEFISDFKNYLIYKKLRGKKSKQVNQQSLIVSLVRLDSILKEFNVKSIEN